MEARRSFADVVRGKLWSGLRVKGSIRCLGMEFTHIGVQGDGNCFYRCLSVWLYGSEGGYNKVRRDVVSYAVTVCKCVKCQQCKKGLIIVLSLAERLQ